MKNGYAMVRRLKLTPFELRVAIDALNAKRLKQKANGIDNRATSNLILYLTICSIAASRSCNGAVGAHGADFNIAMIFS